MTDLLRITHQDTADPKVDALLAQQLSFGFHEPGTGKEKQPLLFRLWFALMVAGLLGGLAAWGLLEPHLEDGIRFKGTLESMQEVDAVMPKGLSNALIRVQGAGFLLPTDLRVLRPDGTRGGLDDLKSARTVEVRGSLERNRTGWSGVAHQVRLLNEAPPAVPVDFADVLGDTRMAFMLLFPLAGAMIGLFIGATDGLLSRAWGRAASSAFTGLVVGLLAGFLALIPAGMIYNLGAGLARSSANPGSYQLSGFPLFIHVMGRGLAWAVVGLAAGLGQGVAMRSMRLLVNGIIGGTVGALLGGVLFDPIYLLFTHFNPAAGGGPSRLVGLALVGAGTGVMIGMVEFLARESWVRILTGPIAGKEFILYHNPTWLGSSPKCEIYLFKDPQVGPRHASIQRAGEHYELVDGGSPSGTTVDGQKGNRIRLRDKSRITLGKTIMEFRVRDE